MLVSLRKVEISLVVNEDKELGAWNIYKLDNGGRIAAFAEKIVDLFMGSVEMKRPNG